MMPDTKVCKTCGIEKPFALFHREGRPNAAGVRVPTANCKACLKAYKRREWDAKASEREARAAAKDASALEKAVLPRICRTCGIEKPPSDFYAKGVLKSGATQYRPDCIACTIAALDANPAERERIRNATAGWRDEDPERGRKSCRDSRNAHIEERRATQRADRQDPAKRPKILAQGRGTYQRHKTKRIAETKAHRDANPEHYRLYYQDYWRFNKDMASKCCAARRARKAGAEGFHTAKDVRAIRARQNDRCNNPMCGIDLNGRGSLDHIVALVNGGSNWPENLQLLCKPCNSKKRSRDNAVFLEIYASEKGLPWPLPELPDEPPEPIIREAA
jgi:5-methylcytosine-specific restriction endonuclease McrA